MGMKYKSVRERSIAVAANFPNFVNKLPETKILKRIVKVLTSSRTLAIYPFLPSFADCVYLFSNPRENNFLHYNLSPPRSLLISLLFFSRRASYAYHIDTTRWYSPRLDNAFLEENFKDGTRVKIDINTKNICMFNEQSFTSRKSFSRNTTTILVNGSRDAKEARRSILTPVGSTLPLPPLFLPSHKSHKDQRIKGEAKLR